MVPLKSVPNKQKSTPPTKEKEDKNKLVTKRIDINIYSLDIATLTINLDINKYIIKPIEIKILKMSNYIRTTRIMQRRETIIHSLLYKITMLNVKSATIMIIKPVNVDYQCKP